MGGYPDWLPWCEDVVFDLDLRAAGARFTFSPAAIVSWHPPARPAAFWRQYLRYARGDGQAGLWPVRHAIRLGFYAIVGTLLARGSLHSRALAFSLLNAYFRRFVRRIHSVRPAESAPGMAAAYLAVPAIVVVGDVAKMVGYARGTMERLRAGGRQGLVANNSGKVIPYSPATRS